MSAVPQGSPGSQGLQGAQQPPTPPLPRLSPAHLATLPADVVRPGFDPATLQPGIVHLGIGAFMRAHLVPATEAAIGQSDLRWGIVGVSLRSADTRDALAPQQQLYTLAVRDADETGRARQRLQIMAAVTELLVAPEQPGAVLARIAAPATRIVSLTVTEKGYCHDPASGRLRLDHPDIVHDLAHADAPRTAIGYIVRGLALRRAAGAGPLTLMSLDNLPANGQVLRDAVLDFARACAHAENSTLADWIAEACRFPCSMVDRIVPKTTDADRAAIATTLGAHDAWPVLAEPFFDWAVEDQFAAGRPDWALGGARFVAHAEPWERLKLRMVNGAHSSIAYLGAMAGWRTVDEALAQPALRQHIAALLRDEIEPTLPPLPGLQHAAYRAQLLARFANPALAHRTQQIAMDGSQKLPQRLLGTVRDRLAASAPLPRLALGIAAWLHYLRGVDETGAAYAIEDPQAPALQALHRDTVGRRLDVAALHQVLAHTPVFGDLAGHDTLAHALLLPMQRLQQQGVRGALAAISEPSDD